MKFADIKNDIAFRKIFGNENRTEVLISFLNAILEFEGDRRIVSVTILNPYQLPKFRDGKATIIDVKAKDQGNREYIVEMQVAEAAGFSKRVLYYTAGSYVNQIERGEFYQKLNPVIFIGILEFKMTQDPNFLSRHRIKNVQTGEEIFEDFEFNFVELPKFTKTKSEIKTLVDKWVYFIKEAENLEVIPDNTDDEGLRLAYEEANIQAWEKDELAAYDYASMREQDERGRLELAEMRAEARGKAQGEAQGEARGEARGEIKGKESRNYEIAQNMKAKGIDVQVISEITGLSVKAIEEL